MYLGAPTVGLVPLAVVTVTGTDEPAAPGGAVAWTSVLEITVKLRAFLEPKATLVVPSKALPKIVTTLPAGPADGFKRNASGDAVSEVTEAVSVDAPCVTS